LEPRVLALRLYSRIYLHNHEVTFLARRLLGVNRTGGHLSQKANSLNLSDPPNETITINGVLVPVAWNPSGRVVCVAVSTFDEKEYRIACHDDADQWRDYLNHEVAVSGRPYQRGPEQWITVQSFHFMDRTPPAELTKK
jgi:hypothetical protein